MGREGRISVESGHLMKRITLTVRLKGFYLLRWRVRIGLRLLRAAVHVMGCSLEVNIAS